MDATTAIQNIMATPDNRAVDKELVEAATSHCGAFIAPLVLMLRHPHNTLSDDEITGAVTRIALSLTDTGRLRHLIDPAGSGIYDRFYPETDSHSTPTTESAIETFLDTYGNIDPAEESLLKKMIFNPVPEYASTLAANTDISVASRPRDKQDDRLDAFIITHSEASGTKPKPLVVENASTESERQQKESPAGTALVNNTPAVPTSSSFQESLARIFIKEHNYQGAYQIIHNISLNNPEKSIYFADQLRFLRLLIDNQERLNNKKNKKKLL